MQGPRHAWADDMMQRACRSRGHAQAVGMQGPLTCKGHGHAGAVGIQGPRACKGRGMRQPRYAGAAGMHELRACRGCGRAWAAGCKGRGHAGAAGMQGLPACRCCGHAWTTACKGRGHARAAGMQGPRAWQQPKDLRALAPLPRVCVRTASERQRLGSARLLPESCKRIYLRNRCRGRSAVGLRAATTPKAAKPATPAMTVLNSTATSLGRIDDRRCDHAVRRDVLH